MIATTATNITDNIPTGRTVHFFISPPVFVQRKRARTATAIRALMPHEPVVNFC
jgi:hypothetical protein